MASLACHMYIGQLYYLASAHKVNQCPHIVETSKNTRRKICSGSGERVFELNKKKPTRRKPNQTKPFRKKTKVLSIRYKIT